MLRVQLSGRPLPSHFRTQGRGGEEYLPEGHHEWVERIFDCFSKDNQLIPRSPLKARVEELRPGDVRRTKLRAVKELRGPVF